MKDIVVLAFFLFLSGCLIGQIKSLNHISKYRSEIEGHDPSDYLLDSSQNRISIVTDNRNSNTSLSHSVFGYLPYWEYPDALAYLQYDLLSHIAKLDFWVNADGSLVYPVNWSWSVIWLPHMLSMKMIQQSILNI